MTAVITRTVDGGLSALVAGVRTLLYPEAQKRFFARSPDAQIVFTLASGGAVNGALLRQAGQEVRFKKIA